MPGLYFIGEVVDVTGWLGGYNFQWAWASAVAAAEAISERRSVDAERHRLGHMDAIDARGKYTAGITCTFARRI